jgi:hypothetical protein
VKFRSYWSDPIWRGLRVITFVTATSTVVILVAYLAGETSWLDALAAVVVANVGLNIALVIRTMVVRARNRHSRGISP